MYTIEIGRKGDEAQKRHRNSDKCVKNATYYENRHQLMRQR